MEQLINEYSRACAGLKAHKRAAANIKEQLNIISNYFDSISTVGEGQNLCVALRNSNPKVKALSQIPPLQIYLRQGEITNALDSLFDACWTFVKTCGDEIMTEDIEAQREIYESDRKADSVNLRRLLRECLRRDDLQQVLEDLTERELVSLQTAVKLEASLSGTSSDAVQLYHEFLSRLEPMLSKRTHKLQDLTGQIVRIGQSPVAYGAVCAVWMGELYNKRVTLHSSMKRQFRPPSEDVAELKNSLIWAQFEHPHILSLLGIYRDFNQSGVALVSPWMEHGTIRSYIRSNPGADRLKLITEIASGLVYLHSRSPPYIHGLLTGDGVLVNDEKSAVVGGFASTTFERGWMTPLRWLAPELAERSSGVASSLAGDAYAFGMTVYEIMTGQIPFEDVRTPVSILKMLSRGKRPERPNRKLIHVGLDDRLWLLITLCWAQDPTARPSMAEVLKELEEMRKLPALDVRDLSDLITLSDEVICIFASGGFGDIRRGTMKGLGPVALKTLVLKSQMQPVLRLTKRFLREASIWKSLQHPNILPFLGTADLPGLTTCLVSPWMQNGNCIDYLSSNPSISPLPLAQGITRGLTYLHNHAPSVIHGDLRGANVVVNGAGGPLLCDFGLAVVVEDLTRMPISSALQGSGNPRWMAPELLIGEEIVSQASDVWALGMVFLEIMTLDIPFSELKNYPQVVLTIHNSGRPCRPTEHNVLERGLTHDLWDLMQRCWSQVASERPTAGQVLNELEAMEIGSDVMQID